MTPEILVPLAGPELDPERASEQALPYARALANRLSGDLVLVSVVDSAEMAPQREAYLQSLIDDRPDRHHPPAVVVSSEPAEAIAGIAERLENAIIVMASHSRTGLKRMLLGSVALQVVLETSRPVMVVPVAGRQPQQDELPEMTRLLLPLEDSFMAEAAIQIATGMLGPDNLALHLIDVLEPLSTRTGFMEGEYQSTVRQAATHYLNRVADDLRGQGFAVDWQIRVGDPAVEIATVAAETGADLIVMATHGRAGLGRIILGSVGKHQSGGTPVPLLLVRPGDDVIQQAREEARAVRTSFG